MYALRSLLTRIRISVKPRIGSTLSPGMTSVISLIITVIFELFVTYPLYHHKKRKESKLGIFACNILIFTSDSFAPNVKKFLM